MNFLSLTLSLLGNAMYWWTSLMRERRLSNSPQVQYWNDLKSVLRRRQIPSYYHRELMDKKWVWKSLGKKWDSI